MRREYAEILKQVEELALYSTTLQDGNIVGNMEIDNELVGFTIYPSRGVIRVLPSDGTVYVVINEGDHASLSFEGNSKLYMSAKLPQYLYSGL